MNRMTHQVGSSWVMNRKTALLELLLSFQIARRVASTHSPAGTRSDNSNRGLMEPRRVSDAESKWVRVFVFSVVYVLRNQLPSSFFFFLFQGHVAAATPLPPWGCWRLASESSPTTARPPSLARSRWSPAPPTLKVRTLATAAVQTLLPPS